MADNLSGKPIKPRTSGGIRRPGQASGKYAPAPKHKEKPVQEKAPVSTSPVKEQKTTLQPRRRKTRANLRFEKDVNQRRRKTAITTLFIVLIILVTTFSGFLAYTYMTDNINNPITQDSIYLEQDSLVKFRVEKQESTRSISDRLYDMGLIANKTMYRFLSKFNGYDGMYNAGTYTLSKGLSYDEIMYILAETPPETIKVTFPEGFTTDQIAARLEANNLCSATDFLHALGTVDISEYPFLQNIDFSTRDHRLDGYLFPDTYEFDVLSKPEEIIYKMLDRFNAIFKPTFYERLEELGLTLDQVVNLAAMVEREAKLDAERATISGVFYNRYTNWQPGNRKFESCATVRYLYKKLYNEDLITILNEHTKIDHPYNTYMYEGFTPGPICSPGLASLEAALYPSKHQYLYFVAKTDGSGGHIFSKTYAEHLAAKGGQ
ncbi:MAG: endolytic transglycosylase MltG [Clostridia bacterium]|nr:endolytic transglycosylase MltG [Clostridia bacterium]